MTAARRLENPPGVRWLHPQGPKQLATAAVKCCTGDIGASSGFAITWTIVNGKLITNAVTA
jgi:hypothetical protein